MTISLNSKLKDAMWSLFEYVANEDKDTVAHYLPQLRRIARAMDMQPDIFLQETGFPYLSEEELELNI